MINAEDVEGYANTLHEDLLRLTDMLERIAVCLELSIDGERAFSITQSSVVITREDRP